MTQAIASYPQFAVNLLSHALDNLTIFSFFDDALADLLGLETYRHGTSPGCVYSILWTGGQPRLGGRLGHGETGMSSFPDLRKGDYDCHGKFFVMKDNTTNFGPCCLFDCLDKLCENDKASPYIYTATKAEVKNSCVDWTCPITYVTSTVKFRFTPEEALAQGFRNDRTYNDGIAKVTAKPITPDHIGLYGTLAHGLDGGVFQRIADHPDRFINGLYKLAWAVMLTALVVLGFVLAPEAAALASIFLTTQTAFAVCSAALTVFSGCGNIPELEELA
jgi:hypothetical protein